MANQPTQTTEEQQAQEFLKRAEIRTMKKDLYSLREADAMSERDKIAKIKTLEELQQEHQKQLEAREKNAFDTERKKREDVLVKNEKQEYEAEKDLKSYATEPERQQIFLFESQRFEFQKQFDKIEKENEPAVKLEKNKCLLEIQNWQVSLKTLIEKEKKLQDEQKTIIETEQTSTTALQQKSLAQRRGELENEVQEIEKKRWQFETQIQKLQEKIKESDKSSEALVQEKNTLRNKILGIDKSLRDIYSGILAREEDRKRGLLDEQKKRDEELTKARTAQNEKVRREQYIGKDHTASKTFLKDAPDALREKMAKSAQQEAEQRQKFLQDVQQATSKEQKQNQQKSGT